ncbi:MAG: DUF2336 domain-containing protein [Hyphomonadaceae bacterium]
MSAVKSNFARLVDLAKAPDSAHRRDLLREVTDLFFATSGSRSAREAELFDEVMSAVAAEMQEGVLIELSSRFADAADAPMKLLRDLANHELAVAGPVLERSPLLSEQDLLKVVRDRGQGHIHAIAGRKSVSEALSEEIVRKGDDSVLDRLVRNEGAKLSRTAMETVVDRARVNKALHEGVVGRRDLPLDLLNEMYFVCEQRLRQSILARNATVDPLELDAALEKTRLRLQKAALQSSEDLRRAQRYVALKKAANELTPSLLISLYRDKQHNHFLCGLAELTGLDYETARSVVQRRDIDALAMICRASDMERPLFVTIAVLCCGGEKAMNKAEEFGKLYTDVPVDAAQRAMRFYRVRKTAEKEAA